MLLASEPLTPATTPLKLSKVPDAASRAVPPFGASALTYSKCLNPTGYFRSPNDDTPCRQVLSSANAVRIKRGHLSGSAVRAIRVEPSSDLRFIRPSSFKYLPSSLSLQRLIKRRGSAPGAQGMNFFHRHIDVLFLSAASCIVDATGDSQQTSFCLRVVKHPVETRLV